MAYLIDYQYVTMFQLVDNSDLNLNEAIDLAVKNNQLLQANNLDIQTAQILRGGILTLPKTNIRDRKSVV